MEVTHLIFYSFSLLNKPHYKEKRKGRLFLNYCAVIIKVQNSNIGSNKVRACCVRACVEQRHLCKVASKDCYTMSLCVTLFKRASFTWFLPLFFFFSCAARKILAVCDVNPFRHELTCINSLYKCIRFALHSKALNILLKE